MMIQNWSAVTLEALQRLWQGFLGFVPNLIGALIVFVVGWFVSIWIGRFVVEVLKRIKFDKIFEKTKWEEAIKKAEIKMTMSGFIGAIVKWVLVIVFLGAAIKILGPGQFGNFVDSILAWLPNLVVAAGIFVVAVIAGEFGEKLVKAIVGKMDVKYVGLVGTVVRWAIWIFAGFAILEQLGVATDIIRVLITGFVALIVISCSLAFGLGGKDLAKEALEELKKKLKE